MSAETDPLLTLEPLIEAVRQGVEARGWALSGLQKTTSHQFEGRWAGDATRSAYLFFHQPLGSDQVSIDVFLDETSQGLFGNLALVIDAPPLKVVGDVPTALAELAGMAGRALPPGLRTPISVRLRLADADQDPSGADTEIRFKLKIPRAALDAGARTVTALAVGAVASFEGLLSDPALGRFLV